MGVLSLCDSAEDDQRQCSTQKKKVVEPTGSLLHTFPYLFFSQYLSSMSSDNAAVDNVASPDRSSDSTTEARIDTGSKDTSYSTLQTTNDVNGTHDDSSSCSSTNSNESSSTDGEKASSKRPTSDPGYKATSEALVRKLLQLSSPRMDIKIVSVLLHEGKFHYSSFLFPKLNMEWIGVMDIFMSHISRLKEEQDLDISSLSDRIKYAAHKRDTDDFEATKRSYHAMELLCGTSANHYWVQDSCFQTIGNWVLFICMDDTETLNWSFNSQSSCRRIITQVRWQLESLWQDLPTHGSKASLWYDELHDPWWWCIQVLWHIDALFDPWSHCRLYSQPPICLWQQWRISNKATKQFGNAK